VGKGLARSSRFRKGLCCVRIDRVDGPLPDATV
jgi:hypothetical protein